MVQWKARNTLEVEVNAEALTSEVQQTLAAASYYPAGWIAVEPADEGGRLESWIPSDAAMTMRFVFAPLRDYRRGAQIGCCSYAYDERVKTGEEVSPWARTFGKSESDKVNGMALYFIHNTCIEGLQR